MYFEELWKRHRKNAKNEKRRKKLETKSKELSIRATGNRQVIGSTGRKRRDDGLKAGFRKRASCPDPAGHLGSAWNGILACPGEALQ